MESRLQEKEHQIKNFYSPAAANLGGATRRRVPTQSAQSDAQTLVAERTTIPSALAAESAHTHTKKK